MSSIYRTAYVVTERNGRSFWNRIGVTFLNRDGSETVSLDALPVGGKLILREGTFAGSSGGAGGSSSGMGGSSSSVGGSGGSGGAAGGGRYVPPPGFEKEIDDDDIPF